MVGKLDKFIDFLASASSATIVVNADHFNAASKTLNELRHDIGVIIVNFKTGNFATVSLNEDDTLTFMTENIVLNRLEELHLNEAINNFVRI